MNISFSIIIPHKNCPELLERCLKSIPKREDLEIIVVDDNSDEGRKPKGERKNLSIILLDTAQAKGAGRARNVGMKHARGKWLLFADADDYYTDYLNVLLDKYADDETNEIVYLNAVAVDENGCQQPLKINKLIEDYKADKDYSEMMLKYNFWTPWSRMVRRSVVEEDQILFDEIPAGNDMNFCLECSLRAGRMAVEDSYLYCYYRPQSNSQTDKRRYEESLSDDVLNAMLRTNNIYNQADYRYKRAYFDYFYCFGYCRGLGLKGRMKEYWRVLKQLNVNPIADLWQFCRNERARRKGLL